MARLMPSDVSHLALAGGRAEELDTLRQLQAELPAAYTVFHGIHWSREYRDGIKFGELDFVVVNQAGKVLVIEQKNGRLEETEGGLVKMYADRAKPVGDQVRRNLNGVREKFKAAQHYQADLQLDYLIYCPDHRVSNLNAAALDGSRIVDAESRGRLAERVGSLLGPGQPCPHAERVHQFFRQTFDLVPDIHAHVSSQDRNFTRLSTELVHLLQGLEMKPFRLRVDGTAGAGKTLVARQFFDEVVSRGRRPLFVCYNRPLAEKFAAGIGAEGMVATFHGVCRQFLAARGHRFDWDEVKRDPTFWTRMTELVVGESIPENWKFDTLIVDEGQDFEPEWVEILKLFLRDDREILWLDDQDQNLRDQPPVVLDGFVGYHARRNYRSPDSIARFIRRTLPFKFEGANDLPGLGVGVTPYAKAAEQPAAVAKIVTGLLAQGFGHDDIVILTLRGGAESVFSDRERVGSYVLRRFTQGYDLFGNQLMTPGKLLFESVRRFKGQQAPAIVLVDIDPTPDRKEVFQRLLYSGMTRATVRLELVAKADNPLNEAFLRRE
jgi:UvrD-like helicase family protein/AAA domain-containing protein/nuclease-like protein